MLRTEKQRKKLCGDCPIARAADTVGDSFSLLVVRDLMGAPKRFGELHDSLGMSTRTLTRTLRHLEECGCVEKKGYDYALTKKGRALKKIIAEMKNYGSKYL